MTMIKCEFVRKQGTHSLYKINDRYIVYLHDLANNQNIVIDTKDDTDITNTKKGQECIIVAYCTKNPRWKNE